MTPTVAHALAQIDAAQAAFQAHPLKSVSKRDARFIDSNANEAHQVAADGGSFDVDAARAFVAYIAARTLKAHRVTWADMPAPASRPAMVQQVAQLQQARDTRAPRIADVAAASNGRVVIVQATTRAAVAADKAKARTPRAAKPAPAAHPLAARSLVVSIDGGPFVAVPFTCDEMGGPAEFARAVIAPLVWAATGIVPTFDHVASAEAGRVYSGTFKVGRARVVAFSFKLAPVATPEPAPAPAVEPAKPAKAPATPAANAARKVASEAARTVAPAPAAVTRPLRYTVTIKGRGTFTVDRASPEQSNGGLASVTAAPRVAELCGVQRANVETVTPTGAGFVVRYALGKGDSILAEFTPDATADAPLPTAQPLPAFVTRGGMTVSSMAVAAGLAPKSADPIAKALAARDALNTMAGAAVGRATPAGSPAVAERRRHLDAANRNKLALREAQPRRTAAVQALYDAAATGTLPTVPDFSKETHARYRKPLAEVVAKVAAGDLVWLKAHPVQALSSSRVILRRYIDLAILALESQAGAKA